MSEIFGAIKLKNKITIASSMLVLAVLLTTVIGVLTYVTTDRHTHIYDYTLERAEDGSFSLSGVCSVDNCESPFFSKKNLEGVRLLTAESPTCSKEGNRVYTYTHNGATVKYIEKLPMTAHSYEFDIVNKNGVTCLDGKCTAEGCENPDVFVSNVEELKLVSTIPGTCFSPREDTYSYVVNGEEHTFVTLVEENIPHTLNGVSAESLMDADGNYPVGTAGVRLSKNEPIACGTTADGYYICEVCKQVEVVKVVRGPHEFLYDETKLTAPDVDKDGSAVLHCHNTECTETVEVVLPKVEVGTTAFVVSPATELHPQVLKYSFTSTEYGFSFEKEYQVGEKLSHDYKYKLEPNKEISGQFDLVGVCSQPECQNPELRTEDVPAVFVRDTSTCQIPGYVTWSYDYNGETLYFTAPSLKTSDHSYTYDEERAIHPSLTKAGLIELFCSTGGCDHSVVVELPKVVVGENAIYVSETDIGEVYEYSYKTDYGCTVVLNVIIYKK